MQRCGCPATRRRRSWFISSAAASRTRNTSSSVSWPARTATFARRGPEAPKAKGRRGAKRVTATLKEVREMRPDRHRDHHLHRPAQPRRLAALGERRGRPPVRPQTAGLSGLFRGRPAGRASAASNLTAMEILMAYRDTAKRRRKDRERIARRTAERRLAGLCPRCGRVAPAPDRSVCEKCAAKRNRSARARDARLRAAGKPRRDTTKARAAKRRRSRREAQRRREAGFCIRCGKLPAAPERTVCEPCLEKEAGGGPGALPGRQGCGVEVRRGGHRSETAQRPG